jgi:hypothetical protein
MSAKATPLAPSLANAKAQSRPIPLPRAWVNPAVIYEFLILYTPAPVTKANPSTDILACLFFRFTADPIVQAYRMLRLIYSDVAVDFAA